MSEQCPECSYDAHGNKYKWCQNCPLDLEWTPSNDTREIHTAPLLEQITTLAAKNEELKGELDVALRMKRVAESQATALEEANTELERQLGEANNDSFERALKACGLLTPGRVFDEMKEKLTARDREVEEETERLEWLCRLIRDRLDSESLLDIATQLFGDAPCGCRTATCEHTPSAPQSVESFRNAIDVAREAGIGWTMKSIHEALSARGGEGETKA